MNEKYISTPLNFEKIKELRAGDVVFLTGNILSARDAAHKRLVEAIFNSKELPINLKGQIIFYVGPSPTPPGKVSGSIGPTTSARMDIYTEPILKAGVVATIGKGSRSKEIKDVFLKYKAVYFVTCGGVSAYLSQKVEDIKIVAYQDLGPEAIYSIQVKDFPLFVAYDIYGNDIFNLN